MGKFLGLVKVSADEATRMVSDGLHARRAFVDLIVGEGGGTLEGFWLTNVGDWDMVLLVDMGEATAATGAAATLARRAAHLTDDERWIELVEIDDAATALMAMAQGASPDSST